MAAVAVPVVLGSLAAVGEPVWQQPACTFGRPVC